MQDLPRIRCENITAEIIQKYQEHGFEVAFLEYVMEHDLRSISEVQTPPILEFKRWSSDLEHEFYRAYSASFRDRPGFPGWSLKQWVEWISFDPSFLPHLTFLATVNNHAVGFIACANDQESPDRQGYIIQVGVVPEWRRNGVATMLTNRSLDEFRRAGKDSVILHVNRNNPGAIHLYERLGFKTIRIRGAFEKAAHQ